MTLTPDCDKPDRLTGILALVAEKAGAPDHVPTLDDLAGVMRDSERDDTATIAADTLRALLPLLPPAMVTIMRSMIDVYLVNSGILRALLFPPDAPDGDAIVRYHDRWKALPSDTGPPHFLIPLVDAWQHRAKLASCRHIIVPAPGMNRTAHVLDAASAPLVEVIDVDGEPLASAAPSERAAARRSYRIHRIPAARQRKLFPDTMPPHPTGDLILSALAQYPLVRDERRAGAIRGDIKRVAELAMNLTGATTITEAQGVFLLTGSATVTDASKQRWHEAVEVGRALTLRINERTHEWRELLNASSVGKDAAVVLAPPVWFVNERHESTGVGWRLSSSLWTPAGDTTNGLQQGYWGAIARTLSGFEAILSYTSTAGRGRDGRIADALRPVRTGGPGAPLFLTWREVLACAGEYVDPADTGGKDSSAGRRYRWRISEMARLGHLCASRSATAPAGGTVEIVERKNGGRGHEAGLMIRATARYCEAARKAQHRENWTRVPAQNLLGGEYVGGACG